LNEAKSPSTHRGSCEMKRSACEEYWTCTRHSWPQLNRAQRRSNRRLKRRISLLPIKYL